MQSEHHFVVAVVKNCHEYLLKIQGQFLNEMTGGVGSWGLFSTPIVNSKWSPCTHAIALSNTLFQNTSRTLQKELKLVTINSGSEKIIYHPVLFYSSYFVPTVAHEYPLWVDEAIIVKAIYNDEFATHKLFAPGTAEILKQVISE